MAGPACFSSKLCLNCATKCSFFFLLLPLFTSCDYWGFYSSVYLSLLKGPLLDPLINKDHVCIKERVHRPVKTEKITIYLQMVSSNLHGYHCENKLWFSCQKKLHFSIQVMQPLPNYVNFHENSQILAACIAMAMADK